MTSKSVLLLLLVVTTLIGMVSTIPVFSAPSKNRGCGPVGINIDFLLQKVNQSELTPCCVQHDACYATCGMNRTTCDSNFLNCMTNACATQNPSSNDCLKYATGLYWIVRAAGEPSYVITQAVNGCQSI
jgi:secretory phospholipase A2